MNVRSGGPGLFIISLDFELFWGIRDHTRLSDCKEDLLGARRAVHVLLDLFRARSIHATWATVGMLFAHTREELLLHAPTRRPEYANPRLSAYTEFSSLGRDENDDPFHFAGSLVDRIAATNGQELGTHTFSHLYSLEPGVSVEDFEADLRAARSIGERHGDVLRSIVFPRNQVNREHLPVLDRLGVRAFRQNPNHWPYDAQPGAGETRARRAARLLDAYLPVTGARTAPRPVATATSGATAFRASMFLRPYSPSLAAFDRLRVARMKAGLRSAAREGTMFHLWWHPHNFGRHLSENMAVLSALLDEFETLRRRHGMVSVSMVEATASPIPTGVGR